MGCNPFSSWHFEGSGGQNKITVSYLSSLCKTKLETPAWTRTAGQIRPGFEKAAQSRQLDEAGFERVCLLLGDLLKLWMSFPRKTNPKTGTLKTTTDPCHKGRPSKSGNMRKSPRVCNPKGHRAWGHKGLRLESGGVAWESQLGFQREKPKRKLPSSGTHKMSPGQNYLLPKRKWAQRSPKMRAKVRSPHVPLKWTIDIHRLATPAPLALPFA